LETEHEFCRMLPTPTFTGDRITVGDRWWAVPYPVADARRIAGRIVVIYHYLCGPRDAAFHNVEAFDDAGQRLWTAQSPGTGATSAYVRFMAEEPLIIWNFTGDRCTIDPTTGKLLKVEFAK
jgi:hypothetical protein